MRRWMMVLLCGVMMLTACGKTEASPIVSGFRCRVDMNYDGLEASGVLDMTEEGITTLSFDSPDSLAGFGLQWDGSAVTYCYGALSLELDAQTLPVGTAITVIVKAFERCAAHPSRDRSTVSGEDAFGAYELTFDPDSGYPLSLSCADIQLKASFSQWESA